MRVPNKLTHEKIEAYCRYRAVFLLGELSNHIEWSADHTLEFIEHYIHAGTIREATLLEKSSRGLLSHTSAYVWEMA